MTSKIMIVDNHFIIREGIKLIFESHSDYDIAYEAADGDEAIDIIKQSQVDLVLLDIKMPKKDGFEVMSFIHDHFPDLPVVVLSTFDNVVNIQRMLKLGAKGYLLKDASTETIFTTVDSAITGNMVLQNQISDILFSQNHAEKRPKEKQDYNLSEKELKILSRVARGVKIKLIALEMHLSERTIKSNLTDIYIKMNVSTGVQAVALAVKNNLIDID